MAALSNFVYLLRAKAPGIVDPTGRKCRMIVPDRVVAGAVVVGDPYLPNVLSCPVSTDCVTCKCSEKLSG